jgi:hypothetical protein
VGRQHGHPVITAKRRFSRQHLERRAAERVLVGSAVHALAADLLGRCVVDGPKEQPGAGQANRPGRFLAQPEVRQVQVIGPAWARVEQHVRRLDVAVDEPARMGRIQGRGDRRHDRGDPVGRERSLPVEQRPHVAAGDVAHRDEQDAARLAGLVQRDDVRVIDGGGGLGLPVEPLPERLVGGQRRSQDLERDDPAELLVASTEYRRHPAVPDLLLEQVPADPRARCKAASAHRCFLAHHAPDPCADRPWQP